MFRYRIFIFDFDGVILNSHKIKTQTFQKIFSRYGTSVGINAKKLHLRHMGVSRKKKINLINSLYLNKFLTRNELDKINNEFKEIVQNKILKMQLNKNLINFFKLKKNNNIYISTGTDQNEIENLCKMKKIKHFFAKIYGSPKTKIQHISDIIRRNNVDRKNILFIGDSFSDYKAAKIKKIDFLCKSNSENKNIFKNMKIKKINSFRHLHKL